ncbi:hypothetical protein V8C86DRAFT_758234 [Haematococcus lacustris]
MRCSEVHMLLLSRRQPGLAQPDPRPGGSPGRCQARCRQPVVPLGAAGGPQPGKHRGGRGRWGASRAGGSEGPSRAGSRRCSWAGSRSRANFHNWSKRTTGSSRRRQGWGRGGNRYSQQLRRGPPVGGGSSKEPDGGSRPQGNICSKHSQHGCHPASTYTLPHTTFLPPSHHLPSRSCSTSTKQCRASPTCASQPASSQPASQPPAWPDIRWLRALGR